MAFYKIKKLLQDTTSHIPVTYELKAHKAHNDLLVASTLIVVTIIIVYIINSSNQ